MWWRRRKSAKKLAERLAEQFDSVMELNFSRLDRYWYIVKFRHLGVELVAEYQHGTAMLTLSVPKFRNLRDFACSIGECASPGFHSLRQDVFGGEPIPVFASIPCDDAEIETVEAFLADDENRKNIRDLRMGEGDRFTVYTNGLEARFVDGDPDSLGQRLDAIVGLVNRNNKHGKLKLFCKQPVRMIPGVLLRDGTTDGESQARHTFGGDMATQMPSCVNCNAPLHLLATIDAQDPVLAIKRKRRRWLYVVTCLNCDSYASPLFWKEEDGVFEVLDQAEGASFGEFPQILEHRELRLKAVDPQEPSDPAQSPRHRLGGTPDWLQAESVPVCPACDVDMAFVAQFDTDDELGIQFGDDGILCAFICDKCDVMASFAQGH